MTAPRRWSFILCTLFVVATVGTSWLASELRLWIQQRHEVLARPNVSSDIAGAGGIPATQATAPAMLRLLGERGCWAVVVIFIDNKRAAKCTSPQFDVNERMKLMNAAELDEIERIKQLFPEAQVVVGAVLSETENTDGVFALKPATPADGS